MYQTFVYNEGSEDTSQLSRSEEQDLIRRYQQDGDPAALRRLVSAHMRFIYKNARQFQRRNIHLDVADLVQDGMAAMIHGIKKFDPDHGNSLITFVIHDVKGAFLKHAMTHYSIVPIGTSQVQRKMLYQLRRTIKAIAADGMDPTDAEIAKRLKISAKSVTMYRQRILNGQDVSMDGPFFNDSSATPMDRLTSKDNDPSSEAEHAAEVAEVQRRIQAALNNIPAREADIIRRRLIKTPADTLEVIGQSYGITRERTRQLEARAILRLRGLLADLRETADSA